MTELKYFDEFWEVESIWHYHKFEGQSERTRLEFMEVQPVYIHLFEHYWDGSKEARVCPVDYSKKENSQLSWRWSKALKVDQIGKTFFRTKEEAEAKYMEYPEEKRKRWEEIKRIKYLTS